MSTKVIALIRFLALLFILGWAAPSIAQTDQRVQPVGVIVSGEYSPHVASRAIDQDPNTIWSSGGFPVQWIQLDLGSEIVVSRLRLLTAQYPSSQASHGFYGRSAAGAWTVTFGNYSAYTNDYVWIDVGGSSTPVRYVYVQTTESQSWVGWREIEVYTPVAGPPTDNSTFVSQNVPSTMLAGGTYPVSVTMNNSGNTTWAAGQNYRLGSQNPQDNGTWSVGRVELPSSVAPGQNVTFSFNVTAPATPGTYNFQWRMVREYVAWFGAYSNNLTIGTTDFQSDSTPVDMRPYFPVTDATRIYRRTDSSLYMKRVTRGTFDPMLAYNRLPDTSGVHFSREDHVSLSYGSEQTRYNNSWSFRLGSSDKSVMEVADTFEPDAYMCPPGSTVASTWVNGRGQYYSPPAGDSGLSGIAHGRPEGHVLGESPYYRMSQVVHHTCNVVDQNVPVMTLDPAIYGVWSSVQLVGKYNSYRVGYGRSQTNEWGSQFGKTYNNVVVMKFGHGTKRTKAACPSTPAGIDHVAGYVSFWVNLYYAPGIGPVEEDLVFDEDSCSGSATVPEEQKIIYHNFLDQ